MFVVDIFNEGVDVPEIDTVLFLRAYLNLIRSFCKAIGKRSLRKCEKKDVTIVLICPENYKFSPGSACAFKRRESYGCRKKGFYEYTYPEGCNVQFDMKLIDLFEEMAKNDKRLERLRNEYFRLKHRCGKKASPYGFV